MELGEPAEAGGVRGRGERAGGEAFDDVGVVVAAGRDVVGRVGVEERGQVLDVTAADAELELAAAVHADVARLAVGVGAEEAAQRAQARGLDVHHPRREREALDVVDAVDVGVPRDAVAMGLQQLVDLLGQARILDPSVGEGGDDAAVEVRVRAGVDHRALVEALEVHGVDGAGWTISGVQSGVGSSLKRSVG